MVTSTQIKTYAPKKWQLAGLQGISDKTLELHFGLYEGYVKNVNLLNERLAAQRSSGAPKGSDPAFAELVRRQGVFAEYYNTQFGSEESRLGVS